MFGFDIILMRFGVSVKKCAIGTRMNFILNFVVL